MDKRKRVSAVYKWHELRWLCSKVRSMIAVACFIGFLLSSYSAFASIAEAEFFGPFASWLDLKRDFGAKGDGIKDDTEALQKALEAIRPPEAKAAVLFIPSGTYRITRTLRVVREAHSESQHIGIVGENPETTAIVWDGEKGGVMIHYDAWYSRMARLRLDGKGVAKTAILCGPHFVTYNEFTDMIFQDVDIGIEAGRMDTQGIAETVVARSRFTRCAQAGISIQNWNSLDWFIWHCAFEDCRIGVTNAFGAGNFHVYESIFRNSTEADIRIGHAGYFSVRGNLSIGSRSFFRAGWLDACGFVTLQGNFVADTKEVAVEANNLGPLLLFDNTFRTKVAPVVRIRPEAGFLSVGNRFTVKDAIQANPNALRVEDEIVSYDAVKLPLVEMPRIPFPEKSPIIELPSGCKASEIQRAIDEAATMKGRRPVVHLPPGIYEIDRTILIPAGCDLRLVGDGGGDNRGTVLRWRGEGDGPVIRILGPTNVVLDGFAVDGSRKADGILIERCDQPGARIIADQLNIVGAQQIGLLLERVRSTEISLFNMNHGSCKSAIKVLGSRLTIFCGASSNNELSYDVDEGGSLLVRDIWYETGEHPRFMLLKGHGEFTMHAARVATPSKPEDIPVVEIGDFKGDVTFIATDFSCWNEKRRKVEVKGEGARVLVLGCGGDGEDDLLSVSSPYVQAASFQTFRILPGGGWKRARDIGGISSEFLLKMLGPTRTARPKPSSHVGDNLADLRLHRVIVGNARVCVHITSGGDRTSADPFPIPLMKSERPR